ncbi:alanine--tRNA ligase, partial [Rhodococcus erythropolis]|uniref:DHHA1 domain-containing protein n=1 Tax=Rhodococcus erythropolis TaxID=1833 RepID=UPI00139C68AB
PSHVSACEGRLGPELHGVSRHGELAGKVPFGVASSKAGLGHGVKAGELVASFGPMIGGRGGGKPDMAQGSGSDSAGIPAALDAIRDRVGELAGGS